MTTYRELVPSDVQGVVDLANACGFPPRSREGWHWALFENPEQGDLPCGYVAERDGTIIAMIGTQARSFHYGNQRILAASGHTFISSKAGRGSGFTLARKTLANDRFAAIYSLNNNEVAGRFYKRMGLTSWLGPNGRKRLEWPVRPVTMAIGMALSRLARRQCVYVRLSGNEKHAGSARSLTRLQNLPSGIVWLNPSGARDADMIRAFDKGLARAHPIAPVRSPEVYAYQQRDPDAPGRSALLALVAEDAIESLMQVIITKPNAFEPAELHIIDLEILPGCDGARVIPPLIRTARSLARQHRLSRVKLPYSDRFEEVCFDGTGVRIRRQLSYDCAHGRFAKGVEELEKRWVPTGHEGDFFFALRVTPDRRKARKVNTAKRSQTANGFVERRSKA